MAKGLIDFKRIIQTEALEEGIQVERVSKKEIAIIGVSCKFAEANNLDEYWRLLRKGAECIRELPEGRKKENESLLQLKGIKGGAAEYYEGGFMESINEFDCSLFSISPKEAMLMSPNQRLFLETAWSAIEDAGYGGKKLAGSKTGIFTGHSTDFGESYRTFIETLNPALAGISIPGNINSIIASRISYLMDLKGPSVMVDTACSSALVAIHLACRSIRSGECDMAIAGAVKVDLLPLISIKNKEDELGITSPDGRVRAFDDNSNGTGLGEGVGAILLKPLYKAIKDRDNVYAVIKGSAINQDGNSIGLTAPNSATQEEVMLEAWKDAEVDPVTITYIEAHGTGTKLGDPIEINGIQKAFSNYTSRKQFCAIGSVKTNIGHLDNAAGIASLIKAVLMLKHKEIPPIVNFSIPNRKINFEDSPIYVNEKLRQWEPQGFPRRCGISAFGLSGTNCHVVLEEAPSPDYRECSTNDLELNILTLSAKSMEALNVLVSDYIKLFNFSSSLEFGDICHTANTGRGHYSHRMTIMAYDAEELKRKLEEIYSSGIKSEPTKGIYYGEHRMVSDKKNIKSDGELTEDQKKVISQKADDKLLEMQKIRRQAASELIHEICSLYAAGAEVEWELFYSGKSYNKVSLPGYPFDRKRCWIEVEDNGMAIQAVDDKESIHPLIDRLVTESYDRAIYSTDFSVEKHWVLNEHKVGEYYVAPGTAFLEMVRAVSAGRNPGKCVQLRDVVFLYPMILNKSETKEVQTILINEKDFTNFLIIGKTDDKANWEKYSEGKVYLKDSENIPQQNIEELKRECAGEELVYTCSGNAVKTGPRWNCIREVSLGKKGYLSYLTLQEEYIWDLEAYYLHPSLMDEAVNIAQNCIGEELYLPFSYKALTLYRPMSNEIYSYVTRKDSGKDNPEFATFDVVLTDKLGKVLAYAESYIVKKVPNDDERFGDHKQKLKSPEMETAAHPVNNEHSGGLSSIEKDVSQIWAKVLGLKEIDIYESFFNLGGDSILATYLAKEMEKKYKSLLDVTDIFTYSSINEIAEYLSSKIGEEETFEDNSSMVVSVLNTEYDIDQLLDKLVKGEITEEEMAKII